MTDTADASDATVPTAASTGRSGRRGRTSWWPWLAMAVILVTALVVGTLGSSGPVTQQDRVMAIARTLKCPVCSGESVAESNVDASQLIRTDIAKRLEQGQSADQIRSYYAGRYGEGILLTPSSTGVSSLVWIVPVIALVAAAAVLVGVFRHWRIRGDVHATEADRELVEDTLAGWRPVRGRLMAASRGTAARAARARQRAGVAAKAPADAAAPAPTKTRTKPAPAKTSRALDPDRLAALEEERDFLLASLRDLEAEHDAGDVDDGDYAALKDDYTARAAATIRAIDSHQLQMAERPRRSWTQRLVVVGIVAVLAVGAGIFVARSSGQRDASDSVTGGIRANSRDELLAARQDGAKGDYLGAVKAYDAVLAIDPANTEALAYKGWMLRLVAQSASGAQRTQLERQALSSLQAAVRTKADDATSLVFLAVVLGDLDQPDQALAALDKVPAGQIPAFMDDLVGQLRARLQASASPTTTAP